MISTPASRGWTRRFSPALLACFVYLAAIALTGGSSRADSLAQVPALASATLFIVAMTLVPGSWHGRDLRAPFALLGFIALVLTVQLVPLPPSLWASLPGRTFYLEPGATAGLAPGWRPIALVPERGYASLFAVGIPLAMLVGAARLPARERATLLVAFLGLAMVSAVLGLAQLSGGPNSALRWYQYSSDQFASGFFANRNHQALLLAAALPVLAAWATFPSLRSAQRKLRGYVAIGVAAFAVILIPTTGSRAGIVLAALGALAGLAIAAPAIAGVLRAQSQRRRRRTLAIAAGGVVALAGVLFFFGRNEAIRRLYGLSVSEDVRAQALPSVLAMIREFFPVGTGFGAFDLVFRRFEPFDMLSNSYLNQAHNDVLQLVLEGGIAGIATMLAAAGWWVFATVRAIRAPASAERQAALAGATVILLTAIASIFDYPLRTPLAMVLVALAAVWLAMPYGTPARRAP